MPANSFRTSIMNDKKLVHTFKSYLGLDESNYQFNKAIDKPVEDVKPKLLAGELVIGGAHNVLLYAPVSERPVGRIGSLFVTNYKLSFLTDDHTFGGCRQQSLVLGPHDVTLSMIASVYELSGTDEESGNKWRRRPLRPSHPIPRKVQGLQIVCKNMRVLCFGFKFSATAEVRNIANALLHHSFPKRHDLLFAYEYKEPYYSTLGDVNMFQRCNDWKREMDRTNCQVGWRISQANTTADGFFQGAGESLVVPSTVTDHQLSEAAGHFRKGRLPIWVWSAPEGAALVRSGELFSSGSGNTGNSGTPHIHESVLFEAIRRAHPAKTAPKVLPLALPSLRNAFKKLKNLCTPKTMTDFWEQDGQFYSSFDNTRWLKFVSECLSVASIASKHLAENITVILQEGNGMDYCAIVSSLIQLILDSHCRTIKGFQSLIQKEWIALGHPFSDRLGHVKLDDSDMVDGDSREESPIFLLYLDCVWQLQRQYPSSFEFTESYLTTLWDSAHNQLFDTFLFNSPRDRDLAMNKCLTFRSVWDWKEQFSEEDIQYFYNPLYSPPLQHTHPPKSIIPPSAIRLPGLASPQKPVLERLWLSPSSSRLTPNSAISNLDVWHQCYFRWLPLLHLPGAGDIQYLLYHIKLAREVRMLQDRLSNIDVNRKSNGTKEEDSNVVLDCPALNTVGTFFPFIGNTSGVEDSLALLTTSLLEPHQQLDSQSILNAPD